MFELPSLPYGYDALGTYISKDIMYLHHSKHHQAYVDKLNAALKDAPELQGKTIEELMRTLDAVTDPKLRQAIRNNGGGHYNHSLFWQWMSPDGGGEPGGELGRAIAQQYGSYQQFVDTFSQAALSVFGSGWVWLQPDLEIMTTANQDSLLSQGLKAPLLGLDVWEHAYYLDYKNKRDDYVAAWWNTVNWDMVQERFSAQVDTI